MKKILFIVVLLSTTVAFSQQKTFEKEVKKISKKIEIITKQQKDSLKVKVEKINIRLDKKEITKEMATALKKEAAIYHARNIERLVGLQEQKLQQLVQDKASGKLKKITETDNEGTFSIGGVKFKINYDDESYLEREKRRERRRKKRGYRSKRTTSQIIFAMGVNNVLNGDFSSLNNSEYKFWQSHFYEVGFSFKTRLAKDAGKLYFKYGVSYLWNNLRPINNQYHVAIGNVTSLATHTETLTENRLRNVQIIFPMHLEFDFSKNGTYNDGKKRDRRNNSVRIGVGGFFGFNKSTKQFLAYKNAQGTKVEEIQKGEFNTNTINYGLSAYIGYESTSLYVKYDTNTLFKNSDLRNISIGIRFDFD